jgi:hypothetical protein
VYVVLAVNVALLPSRNKAFVSTLEVSFTAVSPAMVVPSVATVALLSTFQEA